MIGVSVMKRTLQSGTGGLCRRCGLQAPRSPEPQVSLSINGVPNSARTAIVSGASGPARSAQHSTISVWTAIAFAKSVCSNSKSLSGRSAETLVACVRLRSRTTRSRRVRAVCGCPIPRSTSAICAASESVWRAGVRTGDRKNPASPASPADPPHPRRQCLLLIGTA